MTDEEKLMKHIRTTLSDLATLRWHEDRYASLPLCVIDAVFSIGVNYESTTRTVKSWCKAQTPEWETHCPLRASLNPHSGYCISEFVGLLERHDFQALAAKIFDNRQRTSSRSGILKAEAVYRFAKILQDFRIETFDDTKDDQKNKQVLKIIKEIPGQGSGISFNYFLILAGSENLVKADRMVCRFIENALGKQVSQETVEALVVNACVKLREEFPNLTPRLLDNKIWNYQRRQARSKAQGACSAYCAPVLTGQG